MAPLMPKAVAKWLIENTKLTFEQIAKFCNLHILEIEALGNEETNRSLRSINPIETGELSIELIKIAELDPNVDIEYLESDAYNKIISRRSTKIKENRFKRKQKPESILWLVSTYPQITNYQISKLLNTTTNMVNSIRSKSYWNYKNLHPKNPVTLGLCGEADITKLLKSSS